MDVDPVVPPIDGFWLESKSAALLLRQSGRKEARVFAFEDVFIMENERLVELDELFGASEVAFGLG